MTVLEREDVDGLRRKMASLEKAVMLMDRRVRREIREMEGRILAAIGSPNQKPRLVTAAEIAEQYGIGYRRFERALRSAKLHWHKPRRRWAAPEGGLEYNDMVAVARKVAVEEGGQE